MGNISPPKNSEAHGLYTLLIYVKNKRTIEVGSTDAILVTDYGYSEHTKRVAQNSGCVSLKTLSCE